MSLASAIAIDRSRAPRGRKACRGANRVGTPITAFVHVMAAIAMTATATTTTVTTITATTTTGTTGGAGCGDDTD